MGKLRDKFKNWLYDFIDESQVEKNKETVQQQSKPQINPKNEIEYWRNEILKYSRLISETRNKLANKDFFKKLTPQEYDELRATIDKAVYSLEFSQQSLEKVLIVKATTPEELGQLKTEAITKFRTQKEESEKTLTKLDKLQDYINMYSAREDISTILTQIQNCKDEDEKTKLFESLKSKFELLKDNFSKHGNPENSSLLDQQYEDLLNGDSNFRNNFIKKLSSENIGLLKGLKSSSKSVLGYNSDKSFESISKLLELKLKETKSKSKTLENNINFLSSVSDEKAIYLLTLTLYSSLYDNAEIVANNIKNMDYSNYSLSEKLQKKIEANKSTVPSSIVSFFRNNFSEDIIDQKRELAIAMYPFLSYEGNESKLEDYINENNNFLSRLIDSGITPEELIEEQQNAQALKDDRMLKILKAAINIEKIPLTRKILAKNSTINSVKEVTSSFFKLDTDLIRALKTLPKKDSKISNASYMKQLAMHLSDVSKGEAERIPEVYSISNMHLRKQIGRADAVDEFTRVINISENTSSEIDNISAAINNANSSPAPSNSSSELDAITAAINNANSNPTPSNSSSELDAITAAINNSNSNPTPSNSSSELDAITAAINNANSNPTPSNSSSELDAITAAINNANSSPAPSNSSSELDAITAAINNANSNPTPSNSSFSKLDIDAEIAKIVEETEASAKKAIDSLIRGGRDDD